jgi:uncharacterized cupin superfamily protein
VQRERVVLGEFAGLTQFGVNLLRLAPGVWSSQLHWHAREDEFVFVVSGEVVLVTEAGEQVPRAGECAGFAAGKAEGRRLQNRSEAEAVMLEMGSRDPQDAVAYPGIDLQLLPGEETYRHLDGTPY